MKKEPKNKAMGSVITVRDIDPGDKSWLKREARQQGISMEKLVRRLIHEGCAKSERCGKPSEIFRCYFGPDHGADLYSPERHGYEPVVFSDENRA